MPYAANRTASLLYEVLGEAARPAVVLAHERGGNTAIWFQQVPVFLERSASLSCWFYWDG